MSGRAQQIKNLIIKFIDDKTSNKTNFQNYNFEMHLKHKLYKIMKHMSFIQTYHDKQRGGQVSERPSH